MVETNQQVCALCDYPIMKHVVPPYDTHPDQIGMTGLWCPTDRRLKNPKPPLDEPLREGNRGRN